MFRASSRTVEAEAALRTATRANPAFAETWYNLADLLDDQGRSEAAVECWIDECPWESAKSEVAAEESLVIEAATKSATCMEASSEA